MIIQLPTYPTPLYRIRKGVSQVKITVRHTGCAGRPLFSGDFHRGSTLLSVKEDRDELFERLPPEIKKLNRQARRERRQKEREVFKREHLDAPRGKR